jgi:hypothetical protein
MSTAIRPAIAELAGCGPFPASTSIDLKTMEHQENLLRLISPPFSNAELKLLIGLFGPDDYFGLAWTLVHLVEQSPQWPVVELLEDQSNEWVGRLRERVDRNSEKE